MNPTLLALPLLLVSQVAWAGNMFRCESGGKVIYQDRKCEITGTGATVKTIEPKKYEVIPYVPPVKSQPLAASSKAKKGTHRSENEIPSFERASKRPLVKIYYDYSGQPRKFEVSQVEDAIRHAAKSWSAGCNVDIEYKGTWKQGETTDGIRFRWSSEMKPEHSGLGSRAGASLNTNMRDAELMEGTVLHEMGHMLGMNGHHDDPTGVMNPAGYKTPYLNANDYKWCNEVVKRLDVARR